MLPRDLQEVTRPVVAGVKAQDLLPEVDGLFGAPGLLAAARGPHPGVHVLGVALGGAEEELLGLLQVAGGVSALAGVEVVSGGHAPADLGAGHLQEPGGARIVWVGRQGGLPVRFRHCGAAELEGAAGGPYGRVGEVGVSGVGALEVRQCVYK